MKLFSRSDLGSNSAHVGILIIRTVVSLLMLTHGISKLMMFFDGTHGEFPPVLGMSPALSLSMAVFAEVICAVLVIVGFATRLACIPLIITMLMALILFHGGDPISDKEPALLYLITYSGLALAGGGRYSADGWMRRCDSNGSPKK